MSKYLLYAGVFLLGASCPALADNSADAPPKVTQIIVARRETNTIYDVNGKPLGFAETRRVLERLAEVSPDEIVHVFVEDGVPSEDLFRVMTLLSRTPERAVYLVPQPKLNGPETPLLRVRLDNSSLRQITPSVVRVIGGLVVNPFAGVFRNAITSDYSRQELLSVWADPNTTLRQKYTAAVALAEPHSTPDELQQMLGAPEERIQTIRHISTSEGERADTILMMRYSFLDGDIYLEFNNQKHPLDTWSLTEIGLIDNQEIKPNHGLESTGAPPAAETPETHP